MTLTLSVAPRLRPSVRGVNRGSELALSEVEGVNHEQTQHWCWGAEGLTTLVHLGKF